MNDKNAEYLVVLVLIVGIVVTGMSLLKEPEERFNPIEFASLLDLADDEEVEKQIIFYLVNRDSEPDVVIMPDYETIYSDYAISITLQDIIDTQGTSLENRTSDSKVRFFRASFIDYEKPDIETHLSGWIDEHKHVHELDGVSILTVEGSGTGGLWVHENEAKWVDLGSDGFYLELRPVYNDYQVSLIESVRVWFVNEYPYDVKTSLPSSAEYWFEPDSKYAGGEVNWELTAHVKIVPANSTYELYQIDEVGLSNCTLYFKTLGKLASLKIGIEG